MKKVFSILLIFIFSINMINAQQDPIGKTDSYLPIVPNSPNVASLSKYGEVPVSKNSGLPQVQVPIHDIDLDGINIPVYLSYHAGGIRVNERAPWTGHGWNIMAGGSITRTVRHLKDDDRYGFIWSDIRIQDIYEACVNNPTNQCDSYVNQMVRVNHLDLEPDIFTYSAPGISGKFMFNQERLTNVYGDIKSFPLTNNKIIPIFNGKEILGWTIIDTQGNEFKFIAGDLLGGPETVRGTESFTVESNGSLPQEYPVEPYSPDYTQTWNLSKITSYKGNVISFDYNESGYMDCNFSGQSRLTGPGGNGNIKTTYIKSEGTFTEIREIEGEFGSIEFIKSSGPREDYPDGGTLKEILIKDSGDNIRKKFSLEYLYTFSDNYPRSTIYGCGGDYTNPFLYDSQNPDRSHYNPYMKHLFLDNIKIFGENNNINEAQTYDFEYYNDHKLPHRNSYAQDFWGYYNGVENSTNFLFDFTQRYENKPDRHIYEDFAVTGMLKKMKYPTGGFTEFTYESNRAIVPSGSAFGFRLVPSDVKTISFFPSETPWSITLENDDYHYKYRKPLLLNKKTFLFGMNEVFERTADFTYLVEYSKDSPSGNTICVYDGENNLPEVGYCSFWLTIRKSNLDPENYQDESDIDLADFENATFDPDFSFNKLIGLETKGAQVETGVYLVEFEVITPRSIPSSGGQQFNVNEDVALISINYRVAKDEIKFFNDYREVEIPVGGQRIKKIEDFTGTGLLTGRREYNYQTKDSIKSSGRVLSTPYFISAQGNGGELLESSLAVSPSITTAAGNIIYTWVTENKVNFTNPQKRLTTIGEYRFYELYTPIYKNPMIPYMEDWRYGQEIRTEIPSKVVSNTGYSDNFVGIIEQDPDTFHFGMLSPTTQMPYTFSMEENITAFQFASGNMNWTGKTFYRLQYGHLLATGKTDTLYYNDNLNNFTVQKTSYDFDNENYYQPSRVKTILDSDKTIVKKFYYPYDLIGIQPFGQELTSANRIAAPMREEAYIIENGNERLLTTNKTLYSNSSGSILPSVIQASKGNESLENRIYYHKYDDSGNLTDMSSDGGAHISYLWGYNKQYPIAKIENASNQTIATALNISLATLLNYDESNISIINTLRSLLSSAKVTTFTYDPMVGIKTVTDPKGYKITYEYDNFGRLKYVKDMEGHVLSENQYRYRND